MSFRDVLLPLITVPPATPVSAIEDAVRLAVSLNAKMSAISCSIKINVPKSPLANYVLDVSSSVAAENKGYAAAANELIAAFRDVAGGAGIYQDGFLEHCSLLQVDDIIVAYARTHDLTIIPALEGYELIAESIIFGSGRPTIVIPQIENGAPSFQLNTAVIAWDFSRPASRAIADAMPILSTMERVYVLTVTHEKKFELSLSGTDISMRLTRRGINVQTDTLNAKGREIGKVISDYVAEKNADVLIMGAFGHSRFRDFILGGATRSMLADPPTPILLSH